MPVATVAAHGSSLELRGDWWHVSWYGAWRVIDGDKVLFGWSSDDTAEAAKPLRGLLVVELPDERAGLQSLVFDNGWRLDLFRDHDTGARFSMGLSTPFPVRFNAWRRRRAALRDRQE